MLTPTAERAEQRPRSTSTSFETDALTSLFPRVAASTIVLLVVLLSIRGETGPKTWDRLAFVSAVGATALLSIRYLRASSNLRSRVAVGIAVCGLVFGIARVERHPLGPGLHPWEGFGTSVVLAAVPIALLIVPISILIRRSRTLSRLLAFLMLSLAVVDLISLIRDLSGFSIATNNIFVLNEVLAPSAGRVPGANFVPQYTNLYGWVFVPFRHLMAPYTLANVAAITISCLGIAAVALAVVLARRCLPRRSLWIALGLTVPLATVTALHNPIDSSIGSYFQELPVRMFPAMLYSVLAVPSLVALAHRHTPKRSLALLGLLAGVMVWNSQDFGIAVAAAYGVVLLMATQGSLRKRAVILWLGGFLVGGALYPIWTVAIGHPLQFKFFALTARSYQAGFESALIHLSGPVLLVLPVILGSAAVGATLLRKTVDGSIDLATHQEHAVVTLALVGMWSAFGFVYYLNLSSASAQLQLFLLPVGVCLCALLALCQGALPSAENLPTRLSALMRSLTLWLLPVTLPIAVGFGAILQTPSPSISIDALTRPTASNSFLTTVPVHDILRVMAYARSHGGGSVGYFGPNANYLELATGVRSRILYDDPGDFSLARDAHRLGCDYVRRDPTRWLVVGLAFPPSAGHIVMRPEADGVRSVVPIRSAARFRATSAGAQRCSG